MDEAQARKALAAVARRRIGAEAKASVLRTETDELIRVAFRLGVPKLQLAELSGLTRQTVYSVLLRGGLIH